jgi:hypothetical protein
LNGAQLPKVSSKRLQLQNSDQPYGDLNANAATILKKRNLGNG